MEQSYLKCLSPNPHVLRPQSLDAGRGANDLVDHLLSCLECYRCWYRSRFQMPCQMSAVLPCELKAATTTNSLCPLHAPGGVGQGLVRASTDSGCQSLPPTAANDTPVNR